jgi:hypothetical protein
MVTEQVNATKLATYAELISAISGITLTKGNLPRTISKTVRHDLTTDGGCKDAVAKKYWKTLSVPNVSLVSVITPRRLRCWLYSMTRASHPKPTWQRLYRVRPKICRPYPCRKGHGQMVNKKDDNGNVVQGDKWKDGLDDEELAVFFDEMNALQAARNNYHASEGSKGCTRGSRKRKRDCQ